MSSLADCTIAIVVLYYVIFIVPIIINMIIGNKTTKERIIHSLTMYAGMAGFTIGLFYILVALQYVIGVIF